jgi:hypothetical protein
MKNNANLVPKNRTNAPNNYKSENQRNKQGPLCYDNVYRRKRHVVESIYTPDHNDFHPIAAMSIPTIKSATEGVRFFATFLGVDSEVLLGVIELFFMESAGRRSGTLVTKKSL